MVYWFPRSKLSLDIFLSNNTELPVDKYLMKVFRKAKITREKKALLMYMPFQITIISYLMHLQLYFNWFFPDYKKLNENQRQFWIESIIKTVLFYYLAIIIFLYSRCKYLLYSHVQYLRESQQFSQKALYQLFTLFFPFS